MRYAILDTFEKQEEGLQHLARIDRDLVLVFPYVEPGWLFHSRNVPEPFDLAFVSKDLRVLILETVHPPLGTLRAPAGSFLALESAAGTLSGLGLRAGSLIDDVFWRADEAVERVR